MNNATSSHDIDGLILAFETERERLQTAARKLGIDLDLGEPTATIRRKLSADPPNVFAKDNSEVSGVRLKTTGERLEKVQKLQERTERKIESAEWPAAPKIKEAIEALARDSEVEF